MTKHDKAIEAAIVDWAKSDDKYLPREETMRRAIAAFLRAWEPSAAAMDYADRYQPALRWRYQPTLRWAATVTADELEQP